MTAFATEYTQKHKVTDDFDASAAVLEEFQVYAAEHSIQPSVADWLRERGWLQSLLKQEIFNQALGVAKGDEVEAQRDPVVQRALTRLRAN
jgi:hypothetical protein